VREKRQKHRNRSICSETVGSPTLRCSGSLKFGFKYDVFSFFYYIIHKCLSCMNLSPRGAGADDTEPKCHLCACVGSSLSLPGLPGMCVCTWCRLPHVCVCVQHHLVMSSACAHTRWRAWGTGVVGLGQVGNATLFLCVRVRRRISKLACFVFACAASSVLCVSPPLTTSPTSIE
jgi:hypothetical protein